MITLHSKCKNYFFSNSSTVLILNHSFFVYPSLNKARYYHNTKISLRNFADDTLEDSKDILNLIVINDSFLTLSKSMLTYACTYIDLRFKNNRDHSYLKSTNNNDIKHLVRIGKIILSTLPSELEYSTLIYIRLIRKNSDYFYLDEPFEYKFEGKGEFKGNKFICMYTYYIDDFFEDPKSILNELLNISPGRAFIVLGCFENSISYLELKFLTKFGVNLVTCSNNDNKSTPNQELAFLYWFASGLFFRLIENLTTIVQHGHRLVLKEKRSNKYKLPSYKSNLNKYAKKVRLNLLSELNTKISARCCNLFEDNYGKEKEDPSEYQLFMSLFKNQKYPFRFYAEKFIIHKKINLFVNNIQKQVLEHMYAQYGSRANHPTLRDEDNNIIPYLATKRNIYIIKICNDRTELITVKEQMYTLFVVYLNYSEIYRLNSFIELKGILNDEIYILVEDITRWAYIKSELWAKYGLNIVTVNNNTAGELYKNNTLISDFLTKLVGSKMYFYLVSNSYYNNDILKRLKSATKRLKYIKQNP